MLKLALGIRTSISWFEDEIKAFKIPIYIYQGLKTMFHN